MIKSFKNPPYGNRWTFQKISKIHWFFVLVSAGVQLIFLLVAAVLWI